MNAREQARAVFSTPDGQDYLMRIIKDFGLLREVHTTEEIEVRNAGLRILRSIGLLDEGMVRELLRVFFSMNVTKMETEETERNIERINNMLDGIIPSGKKI